MKLAAIVLVALLGACATGGPGISGDLRNVGGVTMTFKVTPARVKVGQSVRLTVRLVNNVGRPERLTFPSGQRYDFWASQDGNEVWRWSKDRVFTQEIIHSEIPPQNSLVFAEPWTPERPGSYVVHGVLTAERYDRELTGELVVE